MAPIAVRNRCADPTAFLIAQPPQGPDGAARQSDCQMISIIRAAVRLPIVIMRSLPNVPLCGKVLRLGRMGLPILGQRLQMTVERLEQ